MKSQYPHDLITCQNTEPSDYLSTYSGIRQISVEKVQIMKTTYKRMKRNRKDELSAGLEKSEEDGLGSFFYGQTFRLNSED